MNYFFLPLFALLAYLTYKFLILPFIRVQFYRNQGFEVSFLPTIGPKVEFLVSQKIGGDILLASKTLSKRNPDARGKAFALGDRIVLNLMDSKLIKELAFNDQHYRKPDPMILRYLMGTGGLAGLEGEEHKRQRKILTSMLTPDFLDSVMIPEIVSAARGGINRIIRGDLNERVLLPELELVPGEIMGRLFFGEDINRFNPNGHPLTLALADVLGQIEQTWLSPVYWIMGESFVEKGFMPDHRKMLSDAKEFRDECMRIIQERKRAGPQTKKFLIDMLLDTQNNPDPEGRMSDQQILDTLIVFLIPGYQNISIFLQSALYILGKNSDILQELRAEINKIYTRDHIISRESLDKMDYMTAFIKEVLRCYPPPGGNLPRIAIEDHMLGDIQIKEGTVVKVDPFFNNFHVKVYTDPEKFNPKRWLEKNEFADPYFFLPFFAASRKCPGEHLCWLEFKIILSEFIRSFEDIKIPEGYTFEPTIKRRYQPTEDVRFNLKPLMMATSG